MGLRITKKGMIGAGIVATAAVGAVVGMSIYNGNNRSKAGSTATNGVILQGFEWYLEDTGTHWNDMAARAEELSDAGFTAVWLPPAYKADERADEGYAVYDLYDLGEFNQKGTVRTKYGTKDEYLSLIDTLHDNNIQVYADIVLNHKAGADGYETVSAYECNWNDRSSTTSGAYNIGAWTKFNFGGRNGQYSSFTWDASCFDGVDWDQNTSANKLYRFANKSWDWQVDTENGNFDYLMFADVDFDNENVVNEYKNWGEWYVDFANLDGFRLDAVKHIKYTFFKDWLTSVRSATGKELFSVGEYWSGDLSKLSTYIDATDGTTSLFDVPLHYRLYYASTGSGSYDMTQLFDSTLVETNPTCAVTFVDNHDSQPGQSLESTVMSWFKPLAYTAILTREGGYPCVFYGDYYGTNDGGISSQKTVIDKILKARKDYAYGTQHDYLDDANVIGWTREGDSSHSGSGLAALITDGAGGSKSMYVGTSHKGETWYDITGNCTNTVTINDSGYGTFSVQGGSHSIWVPSNGGSNDSTDDNTNNDNTDNNDDVTTADGTTTVYYYNSNNWSNVYVHYGINNSWTTVPGVKMESTSVSGYYYATIDLNGASSATVCFNNGSGSWDSNNGSNYTVNEGVYTVKSGSVSSGAPLGVVVPTEEPTATDEPVATETPVVTDEPVVTEEPTVTDEPVVTETPVETEEPVVTVAPTETPAEDSVTVYYYNSSNWSNVNIHYMVDGGSWTDVPGVAMTKYNDNYYSYTIDLNGASKATVCFNNGNGSWDSRNGANYTVYEGSYIVKDGNATAGTP